jgi:O-antigen chain-terminating methyltransferase
MADVEIESILAEIRQKADNAAPSNAVKPSSGYHPLSSGADQVTMSRYDILEPPFTSHRGIVGKFIISLKNLARELLVQIFDRQVAYNKANTHMVNALTREASEMSAQLDSTRSDMSWQLESIRSELEFSIASSKQLESKITNEYADQLRSDLAETSSKAIDRLESKVVNEHLAALRVELVHTLHSTMDQRLPRTIPTQEQVQELTRLVLDQQRRLAILLEEARRKPFTHDSEGTSSFPTEQRDHLLDTFYLMLEDQFRGTREDIKGRLALYLPYLTNLIPRPVNVLDVGCGRGEFLELLRDNGISADGVDCNSLFVEQCRALGFQVAESDALAFLRGRRDNTYSAISAIHVAEHLPFHDLVALLDEMLRVLRPGGLAILETPNPDNIVVASCTFHIDPSHRKPLPSLLLSFLAEQRGFCKVNTLKLHPYPAHLRLEGSGIAERLNDILFGPQDYAVLGYKV